MSFAVQVEFASATVNDGWIANIDRDLCVAGKYSEIISIVRAAAPSRLKLPAQLFPCTFTGAKWTPNNISELAIPNNNYMCVCAQGKLLSSFVLCLVSCTAGDAETHTQGI